jgi:hypothetical protein
LKNKKVQYRQQVIKVAVPVCLLFFAMAWLAPFWYNKAILIAIGVTMTATAVIEFVTCRSMDV